MNEKWKDIAGYENLYQVSNFGRIKSIRNNKIMSLNKKLRGYHLINFSLNGKRERLYVHRIVAKAFLSNELNYNTVDHIDENKSNNHSKNLQWCTQNQNSNFYHNRRLNKNKIEKHMKLTTKDVHHIRDEFGKRLSTAKKIADGYKISMSLVYRIVYRSVWSSL